MTLTHEALNDLRSRVLAGADVSVEEYAALIATLRAKRTGDVQEAATRKASAKSGAKAPPVELPDSLKDI